MQAHLGLVVAVLLRVRLRRTRHAWEVDGAGRRDKAVQHRQRHVAAPHTCRAMKPAAIGGPDCSRPRQASWLERPSPCLQPLHRGLARRTRKQRCRNSSLHCPHLMVLFSSVERFLHCTLPPVLRHRFQRFLRVVQPGLRLLQLQSGVDCFFFSVLLLPECFLCLGTRFEELRAQTLDKH